MMRCIRLILLTAPLLICLPALSGCGQDTGTTGDVSRSATANKADDAGRNAMKEFMESKTSKKSAKAR